jgi:hypothetical protein
MNNLTTAVTFLDGRSEEEVLELFGEPYSSENDCCEPAWARFLGISVPEKLVYPGQLVEELMEDGRVLDEALDLRLVDFGQGKS